MPLTIVRVKRRREDASAARVVLESEETMAAGDGRDAMRARAAALASALDAVLDGGSAATPYGAYAGSSVVETGDSKVGGEEDALGQRLKRRRCERVAVGVDERDAEAMMDRTWDDYVLNHQGVAKARLERERREHASSGEAYRVLDVTAPKAEEDAAMEAVLMCNYAPMVREYLSKTKNGSGDAPPPFDGELPRANSSKDDGEWVYDMYVMDEDDDGDEDSDEGHVPVIRVRDFHDYVGDGNIDSDFGDSDSNAEDYFGVDYPDTETDDSYASEDFRGYHRGANEDSESYGDEDEY